MSGRHSVELPRVDILLPVFNCEEFLEECLNSLVSQTYENVKIIVLDDASDDSTPEILDKYSLNYKNFTVYHNESNQGIIRSRNKLIDLSQAKYAAFMDADDVCRTDRIEKQVNFLKKNPDYIAVSSYYEAFGYKSYINRPPLEHSDIKAWLMITNALCNPAAMVRIDYLRKNNFRCDESFKGSADYKLWLDCASSQFKVANLPQNLLKYRLHPEQESTKNIGRQRDAHIRIVKKVWSEYRMEPSTAQISNILWNERITLDELQDLSVWIKKVFSDLDLIDKKQEKAIKHRLDINYRRRCKFHGLTGLAVYMGSLGLFQFSKGKFIGLMFFKDCIKYSFFQETK